MNDFEAKLQDKGSNNNFKEITITKVFDIEQNIELFSNFYGETFPKDKKPRWIILQNNRWKIIWDFFITGTLLFITVTVPLRLAFTETDSISWVVVYAIIDFCFLIDVILIFFTSFTNKGHEVVTHKQIAYNYCSTWFFFDVLSILPLDFVMI